MAAPAFERYAPFIREYIYRKGWTDLRQVQVDACAAILDTDKHLIIASGTASGKTEAAFFPILTQLQAHPASSVGVLYVGPLKALINDQFTRLTDLLQEQDIPVFPWHGDVSQSVKRRALRQNRGIVQITPESLEALLMRHEGDAAQLFADLRYIVIDEIHALMGADRGLQLLCLIRRLEVLTHNQPRRIGLSATLHDYAPAMAYLAAGSKRKAMAVGITSQARTLSLCAESFVLPGNLWADAKAEQAYRDFIYQASHRSKCLIFTNSRGQAEETIADMKAIAAERGDKDVFHVHHGSLSTAIRAQTEEALRAQEGPAVAAATLTLELGIDIGDLDLTMQLGAPYSCASFVQRLGRSGRRTGKSRMMFVNLYKDIGGMQSAGSLPWELLRSLAVIELYRQDRWVEPFTVKEKPFSLAAHQTLAVLMTHGEMTPAALAQAVLTLPPFAGRITAEEYRELLRHMLAQDYLQRMDNGGLIPGMKGEQIANHYSFYAVFPEEESYRVLSTSGEVGTLTSCPAVDAVFSLAGRAWRAVTVEPEKRTVYAVPAGSATTPSWLGRQGEVHSRIYRKIREILADTTVYPYLQPQAAELLQKAQEAARRLRLLDREVHPYGSNSLMILPWEGTRILDTIQRLLCEGLREELQVFSCMQGDAFLQLTSALTPEVFVKRLREWEPDPEDPRLVLSEEQEPPKIDKYDALVPESLLRSAYLHNAMDMPGALATLRRLTL